MRTIKALATAAVTGTALILLVQYVILPATARAVTPERRVWLLNAFNAHPALFLLGIVALSAIMALPVLFGAIWFLRKSSK